MNDFVSNNVHIVSSLQATYLQKWCYAMEFNNLIKLLGALQFNVPQTHTTAMLTIHAAKPRMHILATRQIISPRPNIRYGDYLGSTRWWHSQHIPINFIGIFLPLPINSPCTVVFWLVFRQQTFCLQNNTFWT